MSHYHGLNEGVFPNTRVETYSPNGPENRKFNTISNYGEPF